MGQEIDWEKSWVHFSNNTEGAIRREICGILNMPECNNQGKYLGHTFCNLKSRSEAFKGVNRKDGKQIEWMEG